MMCNPVVKAILADFITPNLTNTIAAQVFLQLLLHHSDHPTPVQQGPSVEQLPYLPKLVETTIKAFAKKVNEALLHEGKRKADEMPDGIKKMSALQVT